MFDRYVVQETKIITPPDRLLTEMYKDERQRQWNRFEMSERLNMMITGLYGIHGGPEMSELREIYEYSKSI